MQANVLEIVTLGGISIRSNGKLVTGFVSRKAEALLIYLACTRRQQSREVLADLLWDDRAPDQALSNLRTILASLRKQLQPYILSTHQAVSLDYDSLHIDAAELEAGLMVASKEWQQGRKLSHESALKLDQSLALYHGDFLDGFSIYDSRGFEDWMILERERLQQKVLEGSHHLIESYIAHGLYEQAITQARHLLHLDSLREEAYGQLMTALALTGQRSAALEQYGICQTVLQSELGVNPSEELTALYQKIQSGTFSAARINPEPVQISAVGRRQNLPQQATPFVGRDSELGELEARFADPSCRLLTILGPGGIGKTRLALQYATNQSAAFLDEAYFVSLAPLNAPASIVVAIAEAIHFVFYPQGDPRQQLLDFLRTKKMLLVLDNIEHLLSGVDIVADILRVSSEIKIVVTSRERLSIEGENLFRIESLDCPDWKTPEDALEYSSMKLFLQSARRVKSDFTVTQHNLKDLVRVCRLVGGMPLGILLAAAWVEVLSLPEIVKEIETNLNFLEIDQHDVPERQRSMRLAFEYSWNLLSEAERDVFKNLSVFRNGFTREAASQVANAPLKVLMTLVNKSLLRRDGNTGRYDVHELLRQYAQEYLYASDEDRIAIMDAHCHYYADFMAQQWDTLKTDRQPTALNEIEGEIDNIRAAWHHMVRSRQTVALRQTMPSLRFFLSLRSQYQEGVALFSEAVDALKVAEAEEETSIVLAHLLALQGRFLIATGAHEKGKAAIEKSLSVLPRAAKPQDMLIPLESLSESALHSGQIVKAWQAAHEAIQAARQIPDQWEEAWLLYWLGLVTLEKQEYEEVRKIAQESLQIASVCGDLWLNACLCVLLGRADFALGSYNEAKKQFMQGLAFYEKLGQPWGIAVSYWNLANTAYSSEEYQEAEECFRQSLKIFNATGQTHLSVSVLVDIARVFDAQGQVERALQLLDCIQQNPATAGDVRERARVVSDTLLTKNPQNPVLSANPEASTCDHIMAEFLES